MALVLRTAQEPYFEEGNENLTPIYISSWGGKRRGEISFKNDSEFVLLEYILKTKNEIINFDKDITLKSYYKLTTLKKGSSSTRFLAGTHGSSKRCKA